jgi:hypothetical protein
MEQVASARDTPGVRLGDVAARELEAAEISRNPQRLTEQELERLLQRDP